MKAGTRLLPAIALFACIGLAVSLAACAINTAPVADAGPDQYVSTGTEVTLDGSGSSDADNDTLTYSWSFANVPGGSGITDAALSNATAVDPTFTPDLRGRYVVQLIVNDGTVDSAADTVTITARSWGTAEIIDAGDHAAFEPQVAVDASGNAVAVWQQSDGTYSRIYARRYVTGTGWGTAEIIGTYGAPPQVASDASGNAIAVWSQWDGTSWHIYGNRYASGKGWGTAVEIDAGAYDARFPQVAVDTTGSAFAVWQQSDGTYSRIYARRYAAGTGWDTAEIIDAGAYGAYAAQVAFDPSGNAVAVWSQSDGAHMSIYANRYEAGIWEGAELIETGNDDARNPQVAVDASGNAIAVWYHDFDSTSLNIWSNRYEAGTGWGTEEIIDAGGGYARNPRVAFDERGNAIAVWEQFIWDWRICANRYEAGTGWGTAERINAGSGYADMPQVAVDAGGNAVAVWRQLYGGIGDIWSRRYEAGTGWGTAEIIDAGTNGANYPQVAVDASGNAIAVWQQHDGTISSIFANRYE